MMFTRSSRYGDLPQSTSLNAEGERLLGVSLRLIPDAPAAFLHTVAEGDRLDLLAFKYYGDAGRWWQIADANRGHFDYPTDLLNAGAVAEESLAVTHPSLTGRLLALLRRLQELCAAEFAHARSDGSAELAPTGATIALGYGAAGERESAMATVVAAGFAVSSSHAWPGGEAVEVRDRTIEASWPTLLATLRRLPGMLDVRSDRPVERIALRYNTTQLDRDEIRRRLAAAGYAIVSDQSVRAERTGSQILIPPNGEG